MFVLSVLEAPNTKTNSLCVQTRDVTITGLTINHENSPRLVLPFHILIIIKTVFNYRNLNNSR